MRAGKWGAAAFTAVLMVGGVMVASCGSDSNHDENGTTFSCQAVCQTPNGVLGGDTGSFDGDSEEAAAAACVDDQSSGGDLCNSVGGTFAGRCSCF